MNLIKTSEKNLDYRLMAVDFILTDSYDMVNHTIDYYDKDGVMHTVKVDGDLYSLGYVFSSRTLDGQNVGQLYGI